jgi:hypothetical protein
MMDKGKLNTVNKGVYSQRTVQVNCQIITSDDGKSIKIADRYRPLSSYMIRKTQLVKSNGIKRIHFK